jgi:hypothetical protein
VLKFFRWLRRRSRAWELIEQRQKLIDGLAWRMVFADTAERRELAPLCDRLQRSTVRLRRFYDGKRPWYVSREGA